MTSKRIHVACGAAIVLVLACTTGTSPTLDQDGTNNGKADGQECDVAAFPNLFESTSNMQCTEALDSLSYMYKVSNTISKASLSTRCTLAPLEKTAIDYFVDYWGGVDGYLRFTESDDPIFRTQVTFLEGNHNGQELSATMIEVSDEAGELAMNFIFDHNDLLLLVWDQSQPTGGPTCKNAPLSLEKSEGCIYSFFDVPQEGEVTIWESDTATAELAPTPSIRAAIEMHLQEQELELNTVLSVSSESWVQAARIEVRYANLPPTSYLFSDSSGIPLFLTKTQGDKVEMLCK